jgi:hypothetical protein
MAENDTQTQPPIDFSQMPLPPRDLRWMQVPTERPPKPEIGDDGFTLKLADSGAYAWAPDHWPYQNDTPRGSFPGDVGLAAPYTIYDKAEVWADNASDLYEVAIREQWKAATEIDWGSIEPLAEHVEAALDQIYSNISEQQYNSCSVLSGWLKEISYGYHEVKLYLSTQIFDQARHVEAFRKRALANGGGLGLQAPGFLNRTVRAAFKFTELVAYINVIRSSFLLALCEQADKLAKSKADRQLLDLTAGDLRRHLAYGVEHLRFYLLQGGDEKRRYVLPWIERGEIMMAADIRRDTAMREALILALGNTVAEGKAALKQLREAQIQKYVRALESATFTGHGPRINPALLEIAANP